jgi:DNA-directed RNA polymerase subunit E'/Rpb7
MTSNKSKSSTSTSETSNKSKSSTSTSETSNKSKGSTSTSETSNKSKGSTSTSDTSNKSKGSTSADPSSVLLEIQPVNPYRLINQKTRISIEPFHMNSDIENNMKNILKEKVEKKCNEYGYVDTVYRIIKYSECVMPPENLNGCALSFVTYHCKLCIPIENTIIIGIIKVISQELIVATNGPLMIFIPKENIDTNIWDIPDNYVNKKTKKRLLIDDYIKIQIMAKRINQNDIQIKIIGYLINFASQEEVDTYYGSQIATNKITDDAQGNCNDEDGSCKTTTETTIIESVNITTTTDSNFII